MRCFPIFTPDLLFPGRAAWIGCVSRVSTRPRSLLPYSGVRNMAGGCWRRARRKPSSLTVTMWTRRLYSRQRGRPTPDEVLVTEFMPVGDSRSRLVRRVTGLSGTVLMRQEIRIRPQYATVLPWVSRVRDGAAGGVRRYCWPCRVRTPWPYGENTFRWPKVTGMLGNLRLHRGRTWTSN